MTAIIAWALCAVQPAYAAAFNPHYLISDEELRDASAMRYEDIRTFLDSKGGLGAAYDVDPIDGLLKTVPQLIIDASKRYSVNPKYIMVLIQKESSAVEAKKPTARQLDWLTGYALCDKCSRKNPLAVKYRGVAKQIDAGAGWVDWYFKTALTRKFKVAPNTPVVISKKLVTPANLATAALYNYTPHIHGNRLAWSIWNRWFGDGSLGVEFPDGTLVQNETSGGVALMQGGQFRPVASKSVLDTRFAGRSMVRLNAYDFAALQQNNPGRSVKFSDLSLVRLPDGTVYLLVGDARRRIASPEVFKAIGFNPEEVEDADPADIADYKDGAVIDGANGSPVASLSQDTSTGGVYAIEDGAKKPIWDRAILDANFRGKSIARTSSAALERIPSGSPVTFPDGVLVQAKGAPGVYVISGGKKRPIPSEAVFYAYGYDWSDIVVTTDKALTLHETGEPLALEAKKAKSPAAADDAEVSPAGVQDVTSVVSSQ